MLFAALVNPTLIPIPYRIYQPKRAGNLPIPANPPINKWDTTLIITSSVARTSYVVNNQINLDTNRTILMLGVVPTHRAYLGNARLSYACARGYAHAFDTHF